MAAMVLGSDVVSSTFWASANKAGRSSSCFSVSVGTGRVRRSFTAMLSSDHASNRSPFGLRDVHDRAVARCEVAVGLRVLHECKVFQVRALAELVEKPCA